MMDKHLSGCVKVCKLLSGCVGVCKEVPNPRLNAI